MKALIIVAAVAVAVFAGISEIAFATPHSVDLLAATIPAAAVTVNIEPLLVSVAEAANILASSKSEIYQRIARGELDAVNDGYRTKITFASLKRCAESRPKARIKLYVPRPRARPP